MTDNLPLFAVLCLAIFAGGFLTGVGLYAWVSEDRRVRFPDSTDEAAA